MSLQSASRAVADEQRRPPRSGDTVWLAATGDSKPDKATYFGDCLRVATPRLRTYCRKLTRNDDAADDLVQDASLRAWQARDSFALGSNMGAWVCRIARNTFLSQTRRHRREIPWNPDAHERLLITQPVQDEGLLAGEFKRALEDLPVGQREAFMLVVQQGTSCDVAAAQLNVPGGTVRSRVSRARHAIRRSCLDESLAEPEQSSLDLSPIDHDVTAGAVSEPKDDHEPGSAYAAWKKAGSRWIG